MCCAPGPPLTLTDHVALGKSLSSGLPSSYVSGQQQARWGVISQASLGPAIPLPDPSQPWPCIYSRDFSLSNSAEAGSLAHIFINLAGQK